MTGDEAMRGVAVVIGVAVVEHAGAFLVGVRPPGVPLAGLAEFPGGKCKAGELPADCAARECLEETGLSVSAVKLLLRCEHDYAHGRVELHFWLCRAVDVRDLRADQRGYRWVSSHELGSLNFPDANAPVIAMLQDR